MNHLDLFSGIGGFALAASWAGINTVGFCEIEKFPRKVLQKNFPDVPIHQDIRELNGDHYAGIDIITGGYPCQPFSVAGNQQAQKDARHLWPEMLRVTAQAKPTWVVCENVYGHIKLGLDNVLHDLEGIGYAAQPFVIPAVGAGANHNRERVYIVAHSASDGLNEGKAASCDVKANDDGQKGAKKDRNHEGCSSLRAALDREGDPPRPWGIKPPPLRMDDGLPDRMDRNKAIGNAIVPQVAYEIFRTIILCNKSYRA